MDQLQRVFALAMAYLLPGLILVFAIAFHSPAVQTWLGLALQQNVTIGGASLVLVTSVFAGLLLNGCRFVLFEQVCRVGERIDRQFPCPPATARKDDKIETVYQSLNVQHYAYYQFFGAATIGMPILVVSWGIYQQGAIRWRWVLLGLLIIEYVLATSAYDSLRRFCKKRADLLGDGVRRIHER